jgi:uncharacterized protein
MAIDRRFFLAGALALSVLSGACARSAPTDAQGQPLEPLTVVTSTGEHKFLVEIADSEEERARGLMFRPPLEADRGMLFEWPGEAPRERGFWMHNTPSSLDIIYVATDGRIVSIAHQVTPNSDAIVPSNGVAAGVLELRAGRAQEIGARAGDQIKHPYFGQ